MKKATEFKNYISAWWERQIKKENINLKDNEESIMTLLTWCNGSRLTTEESILLFSTIRNKFENRIADDKINTVNTLRAIDKFDGNAPLKTINNAEILNIDLSDAKVEYEFVKAN